MADPFLGEIRLFSFNFAPKYWALCNGQILPINQNQPLFALVGTMYGGNGQTNFALPDLRGRVPIHMGAGHTLGERGGQEAHTITLQELPAHTHSINVTSDKTNITTIPTANSVIGNAAPSELFSSATPNNSTVNYGAMLPGVISNVGGSQPHENRQPYLTLNFGIALQGIFPSQS